MREPQEWIDVAEYSACEFWLGYVKREDYLAALTKAGLPRRGARSVTVTPGCTAKSRNFLAHHISWIRFEELSIRWWMENVLSRRR